MVATCTFYDAENIYLNDLIIRSSGINDHGEASSFNSFKSRYHNIVVWGLNPWTWDLNVFFDARSPSEKINMSASICSEHVLHISYCNQTSLHSSYLDETQFGTRGSTEEEKYLLGLLRFHCQ